MTPEQLDEIVCRWSTSAAAVADRRPRVCTETDCQRFAGQAVRDVALLIAELRRLRAALYTEQGAPSWH